MLIDMLAGNLNQVALSGGGGATVAAEANRGHSKATPD